MMACKLLKRWWPGTELNRRRQPFQGCSLPKLTVCNPYLYLPFPAHFGPTYWTHNGPNSWTHTRMPEFALTHSQASTSISAPHAAVAGAL